MNEVLLIFDTARLGVAAALMAIGLVLMAGGGIGLLRFPDFYTRLHAAGVSDAVGNIVILLGLAVAAADGGLAPRLLLLAALIAAVSPTISHMAANAAHAGGLAPIAGAYAAPRPGAKR